MNQRNLGLVWDPESHESEFWLPNYRALTEAECRSMAAGTVPDWLREQCREMVEWTLETGPLDYVGRAQARSRRRR